MQYWRILELLGSNDVWCDWAKSKVRCQPTSDFVQTQVRYGSLAARGIFFAVLSRGSTRCIQVGLCARYLSSVSILQVCPALVVKKLSLGWTLSNSRGLTPALFHSLCIYPSRAPLHTLPLMLSPSLPFASKASLFVASWVGVSGGASESSCGGEFYLRLITEEHKRRLLFILIQRIAKTLSPCNINVSPLPGRRSVLDGHRTHSPTHLVDAQYC